MPQPCEDLVGGRQARTHMTSPSEKRFCGPQFADWSTHPRRNPKTFSPLPQNLFSISLTRPPFMVNIPPSSLQRKRDKPFSLPPFLVPSPSSRCRQIGRKQRTIVSDHSYHALAMTNPPLTPGHQKQINKYHSFQYQDELFCPFIDIPLASTSQPSPNGQRDVCMYYRIKCEVRVADKQRVRSLSVASHSLPLPLPIDSPLVSECIPKHKER